MLANYVDSMFIHSFYDPSNFVAEFFQNALIEFVQTLPQLRQLREVQAPPGGGYFRNFWVGMCLWEPGTLNLYQG